MIKARKEEREGRGERDERTESEIRLGGTAGYT